MFMVYALRKYELEEKEVEKMDEIRHTSNMVQNALETNPNTRNSDTYLYYVICREKLQEQGIDINSISLQEALLHRKEYNLPNFETVRRSRQKIQENHPEYSSNSAVKAIRAEREMEFRQYAREGC